jgi:hypothetical protein
VCAPRIVVDVVVLLLVFVVTRGITTEFDLQLALAVLHHLAQCTNLTLHGLVFSEGALERADLVNVAGEDGLHLMQLGLMQQGLEPTKGGERHGFRGRNGR